MKNGGSQCQILGFFGDRFLGIECTVEAETSVSNLTQYKLFIGGDKNNMPFGVAFSFNEQNNSYARAFLIPVHFFAILLETTACS